MMRQRQQQQQAQASLKSAADPTTTDAAGLDLQETASDVVGVGGGEKDSGNAPPHYVQELYRRYKERVAADLSARKGLGAGGAGIADGDGGGREGVQGAASREGGRGGSLAFVDSVVGQLRVRALLS